MIAKKIFEELTFLGGILFYLIFAIFFLFTKGYGVFFQILLSLFIIYFITFLIRLFYFKHRPKKTTYNSFVGKVDASSFPSIHAARITFLTIFIIILYTPSTLYLIFILLLYLLVLYSRIYLLKHDLIDVFGGILLGIFSSISLILI